MQNHTGYPPIDNSAWIHLAVHNKWHSNLFRLEVQLKSAVRPAKLQQAVDAVAARFPMLAAGIRKEKQTFVVVPNPGRLYIRVDCQPLAYMPKEELQDCATRVLYEQHRIAVEIFHSLTDGAGGLQFLKALLAEYFDIPAEPVEEKAAWEDSYRRYAAGKPSSLPGGTSYLLPAAAPESRAVHSTTWTFPANALREKAQAEHTTVTAWLTALFAQTVMKFQQTEKTRGETLLPVQIMVPADLRRRFPSASLRNFSLYALPRLLPEAADAPFSEIVERMTVQLQAQNAYSRLRTAITTNVALEQKTAALPLWLKCAALRSGFEWCGGRSSCITLSNLGPVTFPDGVQQEIEQFCFLLTPRAHSPYNCGVVSTGGTLTLTLTRRGPEQGVEKALQAAFRAQGLVPECEGDITEEA